MSTYVREIGIRGFYQFHHLEYQQSDLNSFISNLILNHFFMFSNHKCISLVLCWIALCQIKNFPCSMPRDCFNCLKVCWTQLTWVSEVYERLTQLAHELHHLEAWNTKKIIPTKCARNPLKRILDIQCS